MHALFFKKVGCEEMYILREKVNISLIKALKDWHDLEKNETYKCSVMKTEFSVKNWCKCEI